MEFHVGRYPHPTMSTDDPNWFNTSSGDSGISCPDRLALVLVIGKSRERSVHILLSGILIPIRSVPALKREDILSFFFKIIVKGPVESSVLCFQF